MLRWRRWRFILPAVALAATSAATVQIASQSAQAAPTAAQSTTNSMTGGLCRNPAHGTGCTDVSYAYPGIGYDNKYVGHDEPSLLFYDKHKGAGNNDTYVIRLPKDPPVAPKQGGGGGTDNFMLHPAFWFGMALCDSQSFPNFTHRCAADTDNNIFTSTNPKSPRYLGKHPGTAFMEMQFYPPGWAPWPAGNSCDATKWCAALNIDSLSSNSAGVVNNSACLNKTGEEYVNFAFLTHNGKSQAPANPFDATNATFTPEPKKDLFMKSGDTLRVRLFDTKAGFRVIVNDLSSHQNGSMTASIANKFAQIDFQPNATKCSVTPYAFHPMYGTSSPSTRVPWAAHSYNVAFSDEIGHFEYCQAIDTTNNAKPCTKAGGTDSTLDNDDVGCFTAAQSTHFPITGCTASDADFDGPTYLRDWPGTQSQRLAAQPYEFLSPTFNGGRKYQQVAFESNMPRIEFQDFNGPGPFCDPSTGANCVNPPPGAQFYPFYTTAGVGSACFWQLGGAHLPNTIRTFGGSSKTEYGTTPLSLTYPIVTNGHPAVQHKFEDFRRVLSSNPC